MKHIMENLKPVDIVNYLDKYIIGQDDAKKAVAVAIRNRIRRMRVSDELKEEIYPKNIILIGPTGVGKTEIARRLSKMVKAPFIKVEASKFTEVGYVGRDVESMIRDLMEMSINMQRKIQMAENETAGIENAENRILDLLLPGSKKEDSPMESFMNALGSVSVNDEDDDEDDEKDEELEAIEEERQKRTREKMKKLLREGKLDEREIEIEITEKQNSFVEVFSSSGIEEMGFNVQNMMGNLFPEKKKSKKLSVKEAMAIFTQEEIADLIDNEKLIKNSKESLEVNGMIFIDEIDKIAGVASQTGPDISREGVQRDILPIIEGTTVVTKYGPIKTDHILFIATGAFHVSKPSDLIPELQGRFPIRVELNELSAQDFEKILKDPDNSLIKQYRALIETEGVNLEFKDSAISEIAEIAHELNTKHENIGARRLHTVCEKVLEKLLFQLPDPEIKEIMVDELYVRENIADILSDEDLSKYIL